MGSKLEVVTHLPVKLSLMDCWDGFDWATEIGTKLGMLHTTHSSRALHPINPYHSPHPLQLCLILPRAPCNCESMSVVDLIRTPEQMTCKTRGVCAHSLHAHGHTSDMKRTRAAVSVSSTTSLHCTPKLSDITCPNICRPWNVRCSSSELLPVVSRGGQGQGRSGLNTIEKCWYGSQDNNEQSGTARHFWCEILSCMETSQTEAGDHPWLEGMSMLTRSGLLSLWCAHTWCASV